MTTGEASAAIHKIQTQQTVCCHHWVIEAPDGPSSHGRCRLCGQMKEFKNVIESAPWAEDSDQESVDGPTEEPDTVKATASNA